jgi:beta-barrel assembly-enhancing protease
VKALRVLLVALVTALLASPILMPAFAIGPEDLPDIGSPAEAAISLDDEYRIGMMITRGLRDTDQILDDPEVAQYIDSIGHRLSSGAQEGNRRFTYFVVKDTTINAFALPGGFIGVNAGLIMETHNESELAGVLAHEISHVTQRHIARSLLAQSKTSIVSTAAMLAAILLGATSGAGDAAMAGIAAAQTLSLQQMMTFSRANEIEADRVGMGVLAQAGFDPNGMPAFFDTMARRAGGNESQIPAIVRSHPITSERIAESKSRAVQYPSQTVSDSTSFALTRERLRVLTTPAGENPSRYYQSTTKAAPDATIKPARVYGNAIALIASDETAKAIPLLKQLRADDETIVQYHTALGQAYSLSGDNDNALQVFEQAVRLFPRNVPVTVRYADALVRANQPKQAHQVLLDLFNVIAPTPEQARQIALAANAAGDVADAYHYMAEFHLMSGDLSLAANQLQMALAVPKITDVQRARFKARLDEIRMAMPRRMRSQSNDPNQGRR